MKVKFYTLGCKVNQYESQAIGEKLQKHGFEITSDKNADVFVVNSCTVTASADQKTRQAVRRFKRNNPDSIVILTGCMPQAYPEKSKELIEADIVLGNKNNSLLPELLLQYKAEGKRIFSVCEHQKGDPFGGDTISGFEERTRAYLKIQDGCNRFCSYCIIPYARGRIRSRKPQNAIEEITKISEQGIKEVVITGIHVASYGKDFEENTISEINEKLGTSKKEYKLIDLLEDIWSKGIIVIVAAGNKGPKDKSISPLGMSKNIFTVGCHDLDYNKEGITLCEKYSGRGPSSYSLKKPDIVAPGTNIFSTCNKCRRNGKHYTDIYESKSGTSFATPLVAGAAALLLEKKSTLTPDEIKFRLCYSATDLKEPWNKQGWGMLNINRALEL